MKEEIWKPISGYNEHYYVSSFGRVKNKFGRFLKQTAKSISKDFNVAANTIFAIKQNRTWVAIQPNE
jgi:hypothetical protein